MPTQKVFRLPQRKSIHDLVVVDEPVPEPSEDQVVVKVRSVALNFRDVAIATGQYQFNVKENPVPGSDIAGDVVAVGSAVTGFAKGDKVISTFDPTTIAGPILNWNGALGGPVDGGLCQYIALSWTALIKVPAASTLSYSQLAALVCTGTTAWNALYGNKPLLPGQTVVFMGTGGVSVTGLILAKAAGARTIITSSSDKKLQYVQEQYGADYIINYKNNPNWGAEVQKLTGGLGADYIFENGGAGTIKQSMEAVAYGGIISAIGFLAKCPQDQMPDVAALCLSKGALLRGIMVGSKMQLEECTRFITVKGLQVPVEKEFGFSRDEVIAALEYMLTGQHIGKVCIKLD
ncbi:hypothetical protein PFICI_04137 [Pestalotiopsis fici W106-1]|uniref:Enoyl reductase (ER) domain-containing protein n=1 Tax=Pestalotiopsis fici (strain W106-1 / CGMCC3.15140) TaxID=1229662 RepID=W3XKW7_PESFW|nr:uncharacterized protein PFICI_04137 [Pestalotiopsis fici W106-1]ETS86112.1 hypothetical protein PFICI_04137 [Pestalotiopsis fici W106-1]